MASPRGVATFTGTDVVIVTTSEITVITRQIRGIHAGEKILLIGDAMITGGAGVTGITLRLRRGSLAGAIVLSDDGDLAEVEDDQVTAGEFHYIGIMATDNALVDDPTYVLTADQVGATGNGTFLKGTLVLIPIG